MDAIQAVHALRLVRSSNHSRHCAQDWLEVKHECLMCKTPTASIDLYFGKTVLLDADVTLPETSRKHSLTDTSEEVDDLAHASVGLRSLRPTSFCGGVHQTTAAHQRQTQHLHDYEQDFR